MRLEVAVSDQRLAEEERSERRRDADDGGRRSEVDGLGGEEGPALGDGGAAGADRAGGELARDREDAEDGDWGLCEEDAAQAVGAGR